MADQISHRLHLYISIPRNSQAFGCFSQRFPHQWELLSRDVSANHPKHSPDFFDIFARAVNRLSSTAILQTLHRILDPLASETTDGFAHRFFSLETKSHRQKPFDFGAKPCRRASASLAYCRLPVISRPSHSGG